MKMLMKSSQRGEGTGDRFNAMRPSKAMNARTTDGPASAPSRKADAPFVRTSTSVSASSHTRTTAALRVTFIIGQKSRFMRTARGVGIRACSSTSAAAAGGRRSAMGAIFAADGAIMVMRRTVIVFLASLKLPTRTHE